MLRLVKKLREYEHAKKTEESSKWYIYVNCIVNIIRELLFVVFSVLANCDSHVQLVSKCNETHKDGNWQYLCAVADRVFIFCIFDNWNTDCQHKPSYLIVKALILIFLISLNAYYHDLYDYEAKGDENSDYLDAGYATFLEQVSDHD